MAKRSKLSAKKKIHSIILFTNGNIIVFDQSGEQVPELQNNPINSVIERAKEMGYFVDSAKIELPCGKAKVLKGYNNYQVKK